MQSKKLIIKAEALQYCNVFIFAPGFRDGIHFCLFFLSCSSADDRRRRSPQKSTGESNPKDAFLISIDIEMCSFQRNRFFKDISTLTADTPAAGLPHLSRWWWKQSNFISWWISHRLHFAADWSAGANGIIYYPRDYSRLVNCYTVPAETSYGKQGWIDSF